MGSVAQEHLTDRGFLPVRPENVPPWLTVRPAWVCWEYDPHKGKVPIDAATLHGASTRDLLTWTDFEHAFGVYEDHDHLDGVGYVLSSGDVLAGLDLDRCVDPETGEAQPWARQRLEAARELGAYVELSASGTGAHAFIPDCRALLEGGKRGQAELYTHARFLTVSGWSL